MKQPMKTICVQTFIGLALALNISCPALMYAQQTDNSTQSKSVPETKKTIHTDQSTHLSTHKRSSKTQPRFLQQSAMRKSSTTLKRKLINKKRFKKYLKAALLCVGSTGTILALISNSTPRYSVNNASKKKNDALMKAPADDPKALPSTVEKKPQKIVILQKQEAPGARKDNGQSLSLLLAIDRNVSPEHLKSLIENNANVNAASQYPALARAARYGNLNVINLLLAHGADINITDRSGETALIAATRNNYVDVVKALVQAKANINSQDSAGYTALYCAINRKHTQNAQTLLEGRADPNMGVCAEKICRLLETDNLDENDCLSQSLSSRTYPPNASTVLLETIAGGCTSMVSMLLKYNADPTIAMQETGLTPLMLATMYQYRAHESYTITKLLLDAQADINAQDSNRQTALHWAIKTHHKATVQLLLDNNADPNATDIDGNTPSHYAERYR